MTTLDDLPIGGSFLYWHTPHAQVADREADGWRNEGPVPGPHGYWSAFMTQDETE